MNSNGPSTKSIKDMLEAVQADRDAKKVFLAMPREEQLLAILGLIAFTNQQLANVQKENIEYRQERERRERQLTDLLESDPDIQKMPDDEKQNTIQKIFALAARPARAGNLVDKILSIILIILFYLTITGRIP